ncbi:hypothetical protein P3W45_001336 [Vairimorpha bombi]
MQNECINENTNSEEIKKDTNIPNSSDIKNIGIALIDDIFCENQDTKLYKIRDKSFNIKNKLTHISESEIEMSKIYIQKLEKEFQVLYPALFTPNPSLIYCHVDLDSFYASVESLEHPEYKTIPLAVGVMNMLTTCNYVARKYGVKAGMPGYIAKQLCPNLKIVRCNFAKYNHYSERVMSVLSMFDENIEIYGIDEACLIFDRTKFEKACKKMNTESDTISTGSDLSFCFQNVQILVEYIRGLVFKSTGLTVSSGISVTRGLSKYACGVNKPDGVFVIEKDFDSHLFELETDKINGIGKATKEMLLKSYNIKYVRELRNNLHLLYLTLPYKTFMNLFNLSYGLSCFDSTRSTRKPTQSVSINTSFRPTSDFYDMCGVLWYLSSSISDKLVRSNTKCKTITVNYKMSTFSSRTKQRKMSKLINSSIDLFNECMDLLIQSRVLTRYNKQDKPIDLFYNIPSDLRQLGISCSDLIKMDTVNVLKVFETVYNPRKCMICERELLFSQEKVIVLIITQIHRKNNLLLRYIEKIIYYSDT